MNQALKYVVAAALAASGVALVATAQTPASSPAPTSVPASAPATAPPVSPERFEPTDKVRADFDVSFPIDI